MHPKHIYLAISLGVIIQTAITLKLNQDMVSNLKEHIVISNKELISNISGICGEINQPVNHQSAQDIINNTAIDNHFSSSFHNRNTATINSDKMALEDAKLDRELDKTILINSLHEHNMTLNSFLSSEKLKSLPDSEKHEIYKEMVRKIDNGEIIKEQFLPGYDINN